MESAVEVVVRKVQAFEVCAVGKRHMDETGDTVPREVERRPGDARGERDC